MDMGHRVLIVGRGRHADVRLTDASVSRLHAELVVADDGMLHLGDCSSANGTWIEQEGEWKRVTQRAVALNDRLRLGSIDISVSELVGRAGSNIGDAARAHPAAGDLPSGPVRRNPKTGAVIAD